MKGNMRSIPKLFFKSNHFYKWFINHCWLMMSKASVYILCLIEILLKDLSQELSIFQEIATRVGLMFFF